MSTPFQLPPAAEEVHRAIAQKATALLKEMAEGNGLQASQVRLLRDDTSINAIPATLRVKLVPEIATTQQRGRNAAGIILETEAEVAPAAAGQAEALLAGGGLQQEVLAALKKTPGEGFGMEPLVLTLKGAGKDFSVVSACTKCGGAASTSCAACQATGRTPCLTCRGEGAVPCTTCFGVGMVQDANGNRVGCARCQNMGRIICGTCNGQRQITCAVCRGQASIPCAACGQSGAMTTVYKVSYTAACRFEADWRAVPAEVRKIAEKISLRTLAAKGHAEVYWQPGEIQAGELVIPCIAFFPTSKAEFSLEGKAYPAVLAGLKGRIVEMEPVLDPVVKPGISALMKLSKGPLAVQALIDTACRYKLICQVLSGLTHQPKKQVYQALVRDYPGVLSDKYARATVLYAYRALLSISTAPRYKGLATGTMLSAALAAGYYMTPLRLLLATQMEQRGFPYIGAIDVIVWGISCALAILTIKLMAAAAFRTMLPKIVTEEKSPLPSAGLQGVAAILTTAIVSAVFAAATKPEWALHLLKLLKP